MKLDFWNNPLVVHAFESPRGRRRVVRTIVQTPVLLVALYWVVQYLTGLAGGAVTPRQALVALLGFEFVAGSIGSLAATASALRNDVRQGTLESLRLTTLTPRELLLGKMLAEPAVGYLAVLSSLPVAALLGVAAGVPLWLVLVAYLNIGTAMIAGGAFGLFQALQARSSKPGSNPAAALLALVSILGVYGLGGGFIGLVQSELWRQSLSLFGAPVPYLVLFPVGFLGLAVLAFRAAERRLTHGPLPPLDKAAAYFVLLVVDVVATGVLFEFNPVAGPSPRQRVGLFALVQVLMTLVLLPAITPGAPALESWVWRYRGRTSRVRDLWLRDRSPNGLSVLTFAVVGLVALFGLLLLPMALHEGPAAALSAWPTVAGAAVVLTAFTFGAGNLIQWIALRVRSGGSGFGVLMAIFLALVPVLAVVYPVLVGMRPNPNWYAAPSPAYHVVMWLGGDPTTAGEVASVALLYLVVGLWSLADLHRRLRLFTAKVDGTLKDMGCAPTPAG